MHSTIRNKKKIHKIMIIDLNIFTDSEDGNSTNQKCSRKEITIKKDWKLSRFAGSMYSSYLLLSYRYNLIDFLSS